MTEKEKDEWRSLHYRMDEEGFDYCFDGYSNWEDIKDEEFHKLRLQYLQSAKDLRQYISDRYKEIY
jgi:Trm5-related predicted tRNA methylase